MRRLWVANNHNGACGISFANGHAGIKKWINPPKKQSVKLAIFSGLNAPNCPGYSWLAERTPKK